MKSLFAVRKKSTTWLLLDKMQFAITTASVLKGSQKLLAPSKLQFTTVVNYSYFATTHPCGQVNINSVVSTIVFNILTDLLMILVCP